MDERRPPTDLKSITDARRIELGKKWKDVLAETKLSHQTLSQWRGGEKVAPLTERAFERALGWAPGAREAIRDGRQPALLEEAPDAGRAGQVAQSRFEWSPSGKARLLLGIEERMTEEQKELWFRLGEAIVNKSVDPLLKEPDGT